MRILGIFAGMMLIALAAGPASASYIDLTTLGAVGQINGAWFLQIENQPTGTGVIDPFLRIQAHGSEQGVNSDGPYTMDEKAGIWTHSLKVGDFGVVQYQGGDYIRMMLDINQTDHSPLLSMDQLRIYAAPTKDYNTVAELDANGTLLYNMGAGNGVNMNYDLNINQTDHSPLLSMDQLRIYAAPTKDYNTVAELDANGTLLYNMGAGNGVNMNYDLNSGSGSGDIFAYLPYNLFGSYTDQYFYLYSQFGASGGDYASNDGFEEWTRLEGTPPNEIPEPATLLLLGGSLLGGALIRRRKR